MLRLKRELLSVPAGNNTASLGTAGQEDCEDRGLSVALKHVDVKTPRS